MKKIGNFKFFWKFDPTPPIKCKTHQIWPTLKWFFRFFVIFFIFFCIFFWNFFFSGHANKWAPKSQYFFIFCPLPPAHIETLHFWWGWAVCHKASFLTYSNPMLNYVHLTETGFEKNSPLIYRKLTFSVEGKMGISEKLE